ncbi:FAD dependent oxidoreductase-domain-containing protein [Naematelia encephala]|uniref:FAD dependent oxidoreductase-domain-containing protein n=1 Tax=Naematelia encephala TaxID=71784 RepID=A0A1Y2AYR1_9TREE|nr:FAD dependent oxidoreductase-domain-containing protein [Naematelia encephala]
MASFPQPFISSTSHWQATNRGASSLYNHNKDTCPPSQADILIIGGGMMGAALSYFLTRKGAEGEGKRIILLEAKDIGSGASGRNGGHVGPATSESYHSLMQPLPFGAGLTSPEAIHVIQAERDNLELIAKIIHDEAITDKVDFWKGRLCEVHQSDEESAIYKARYLSWLAARQSYGLGGNGDTFCYHADLKQVSRFKGTTSVQLRPGGSVHSHKLCTELTRLALNSTHSDYQVYTWTPVSSLTQTNGGWIAHTAKGKIHATKAILCVNAYTKDFFGKEELLHSHIKPHRSQIALITPPATFSGERALRYTYNMQEDGYLMQTPMGGIVLGGGLTELVKEGKLSPSVSDSVDDSGTFKAWDEYLARYCPDNFEGWGPEGKGEGATRLWSGILSAVKDKLPVVGAVPGKEGMYLAAGFHGHGMSRIFSTGRALAAILQSGIYDEHLLPRSFELTTERLERSRDASRVLVKEQASSMALLSEKPAKQDAKKKNFLSACVIA